MKYYITDSVKFLFCQTRITSLVTLIFGWSQENVGFGIECRDQCSFKTHVWYRVFDNQIVGPYFVRETLTAEAYRNLLTNEICEVLEIMDIIITQNLLAQFDVEKYIKLLP